jgi:hypothetical protein
MTITLTRGQLIAATALLATVFLGGTAEAITDTVFKYSTVQTGYLTVPAAAFVSESSADQFAQNGVTIQPATTNTLCMDAPVNLPEGAKMTTIGVWYATNGGLMQVQMFRQNLSTGTNVTLARRVLADTAGSRAQANLAVTGAGQIIKNEAFSYDLNFCTQGATANKFYSARIRYTYSTAGS